MTVVDVLLLVGMIGFLGVVIRWGDRWDDER